MQWTWKTQKQCAWHPSYDISWTLGFRTGACSVTGLSVWSHSRKPGLLSVWRQAWVTIHALRRKRGPFCLTKSVLKASLWCQCGLFQGQHTQITKLSTPVTWSVQVSTWLIRLLLGSVIREGALLNPRCGTSGKLQSKHRRVHYHRQATCTIGVYMVNHLPSIGSLVMDWCNTSLL